MKLGDRVRVSIPVFEGTVWSFNGSYISVAKDDGTITSAVPVQAATVVRTIPDHWPPVPGDLWLLDKDLYVCRAVSNGVFARILESVDGNVFTSYCSDSNFEEVLVNHQRVVLEHRAYWKYGSLWPTGWGRTHLDCLAGV